MKKLICFALIALFSLPLYSQNGRKITRKMRNQIDACKHINGLQNNGVLLIQLSSSVKKQKALREAGKEDLADRFKQKQFKFNQTMLDAFKAEFNFCDVYFYYNHEYQYLKDKQFDKIEFFDVNRQIIPSDNIKNKYLLIGKYDDLLEQFATKEDSIRIIINEYGVKERKAFGGVYPSTQIEGLIIHDIDLRQVKKPFPAFVWNYYELKFVNNNIKALNERLFSFLDRRFPRVERRLGQRIM